MIGRAVSHYKILEKLGGGGMGVVYKARDTKLDRFVALKFLPPHIGQAEEEKKRFIHEAKTASGLDHINICTIYEINETEDGQMFIAMAYYQGETLKASTERGPLPLEEAIDIAMQVGSGLARAHEEKIVHRDIKPANIMITKRGEVKIVDFGLAKLAGRTLLTKEGTTLGTVAYMAPEQARGADVDHRTDLWALGTVLYEMITGRQPFEGDYEQAVMYSIMNEEPVPLTGLRTGVPIELERIVNKCLAKKPSERYQHADDLIVDLRRCQGESTAKNIPFKKMLSSKAPIRRRRYFLGVLVLSIMVVTGYFFFSRKEENKAPIPLAVVDFVNETDEHELNGLSGLLITALEQSRHLSVLTRSRMFDLLKQMGKEDVDHIDELLGRKICRQANVQVMAIASIKKFARVYTIDLKLLAPEKNQYLFTAKEKGEGQESVPDMIDRLAEKTRKELKEKAEEIQAASRKVTEVTTINLEAYQYYFKGEEFISKMKFENAKQEFEQAIALDSTFGLAYYRLAYVLGWKGETVENEMITKALALIDKIPEKERYLVRAHEAKLQKGWQAGIKILKEMEKAYPNDKEMLFNIGDMFHHMRQQSEAAKYLEKVLALDPKHERALQHLSWSYGMMGQFEKGLELAKRYEVVGSPEALGVLLWNLCQIGGLYHQKLEHLTRAMEMDSLNPDYYSLRGHDNRRLGNVDQSIIDYQNALALTPDHLSGLNGLARSLMIAKKYSEAEEHLIRCEKLNPDLPYTKRTRTLLYAAQGKKDEALELLKDNRLDKYNKMAVYCLLGLKDEAIDLIDKEPWTDYLEMLHHPYFEILRDTDEFKTALQKAKEIYEENLKMYQEVFP